MKIISSVRTLSLAVALALASSIPAATADEFSDSVTKVRANYRSDREAFIIENLKLTEAEGAAFWPLYRSYRVDMDGLGDELLKLVLEYADAYPDVPDERAQELLKQYTALEEKHAKKRIWYLNRARKALPAAKVLRWAQLENRMDLALRVQLASIVPLMPNKGAKQ